MFKLRFIRYVLQIAALFVGTAWAAETWTAMPMSANGDTICTDGELVYAIAGGHPDGNSVGQITVNTVPFTTVKSFTDYPGSTFTWPISVSPQLPYDVGGLGTQNVSDSDYAQMLDKGFRNIASMCPYTFTLTGLEPGETYLVQLVAHRNTNGYTITAPDGEAQIKTGFDSEYTYGGTLIGIFDAEDTTYSFTVSYSGSSNKADFNAFQVRKLSNVPVKPSFASLTAVTNGQDVTISIDGVEMGTDDDCVPATSYSINYWLDDGSPSVIPALTDTTESFTIEDLEDGAHTCYVAITSDKGKTSVTNNVRFRIGSVPAPVWTGEPMLETGGNIRRDGTLVYAYCRGASNGSTLEVNGVPFTTYADNGDFSGKQHNVEVSPAVGYWSNGFGDEGLSTSFGSLISGGFWGNSSGFENTMFTLKGLEPDHKYLVQFIVHQINQYSVTASGGGATVQAGGSGWKYGGSLVCEFTAESESAEIVVAYATRMLFNAIQVRDISRVAPSYTVTFDSNGAGVIPSQQVYEGDTVIEPSPAPSRYGYSLDGWFNGNVQWNFATDTVSADMTLTAHWTEVEVPDYTVTFNTDGGSPVPESQIVKGGRYATMPTSPSKAGKDFDGWYNGANKWNFETDVVTDNITLVARWVDMQPVRYSIDDGTSWSGAATIKDAYDAVKGQTDAAIIEMRQSANNLFTFGHFENARCDITLRSSTEPGFGTYTLTRGDHWNHWTVPAGHTLTISNIVVNGGSETGNGMFNVDEGATLTLEAGGVITSSRADNDAGPAIKVDGNLYFEGGVVSGWNVANDPPVYIKEHGTVYIHDGGITNCSNVGVYWQAASAIGGDSYFDGTRTQIYMTGGFIKDNRQLGTSEIPRGAVSSNSGMVMELSGGEISGNTDVDDYCCGLYVGNANAKLKVSGNPVVSGNNRDVYVADAGHFVVNGNIGYEAYLGIYAPALSSYGSVFGSLTSTEISVDGFFENNIDRNLIAYVDGTDLKWSAVVIPSIGSISATTKGGKATITLANVEMGTDDKGQPASEYMVYYTLDDWNTCLDGPEHQTSSSMSFDITGLEPGSYTCEVSITTDKYMVPDENSVVTFTITSAPKIGTMIILR